MLYKCYIIDLVMKQEKNDDRIFKTVEIQEDIQ